VEAVARLREEGGAEEVAVLGALCYKTSLSMIRNPLATVPSLLSHRNGVPVVMGGFRTRGCY
jgi:hypothetical protein